MSDETPMGQLIPKCPEYFAHLLRQLRLRVG